MVANVESVIIGTRHGWTMKHQKRPEGYWNWCKRCHYGNDQNMVLWLFIAGAKNKANDVPAFWGFKLALISL